MKKFFVMVIAAALFIVTAEKAPWAKFFTDPSVPLEQSDWEGKKKSKVPEEEYQRNEDPPDEERREEDIKREKKQQKRYKRKKPSSPGREKIGVGLKVGYNVIPETMIKVNNGNETDIFENAGSRYSFDMNLEIIGNILGGHLGIGVGAGMTMDMGTDDYDESATFVMVPVYAILKGYLFKGSTPFVALGLGYNVYTAFNTTLSSFEGTTQNGGGLYASFSAGFIFKGGFQVEITYAMIKGKVSYDYYDYTTGSYENDMDISHSHLTLGIAYFF